MMDASTCSQDDMVGPMSLFLQSLIQERHQAADLQGDVCNDDDQSMEIQVEVIDDNAPGHPTGNWRFETYPTSFSRGPLSSTRSLDPRWDSRGAPLLSLIPHPKDKALHGSFDNLVDTPIFPPRPPRSRPLGRSRSDEPERSLSLPSQPQRQSSTEMDPPTVSAAWAAANPPLPPVRRDSQSYTSMPALPQRKASDCCLMSSPTPPQGRASLCLEADQPAKQPPRRRISLCLEDGAALCSPAQPQRRVSICSEDGSVLSDLSDLLPMILLRQVSDLSDCPEEEGTLESPNSSSSSLMPCSPLLGPKVVHSKHNLLDDDDDDEEQRDSEDPAYTNMANLLSLITTRSA